MVEIQRIKAIALAVADVDRSIGFYTEALGFKVINDVVFERSLYNHLPSRVRLATLQLGDESIELIQHLDLEPKPIPEDSQSNDLWFQHLAIVVRDIDRAYQHLQNFAIVPISNKPQTMPEDNQLAAGVKAFKFRELNRHSLEIIWFPEGKGKDKWQQGDGLFLGIDHSAISVRDTEQSLQFYRDLLGLEVEGSNLNQGQIQAHLDGLPIAEVRVTPLQPQTPSIGVELLDYKQPGTGKTRPEAWQMSDIAHLHYVMEVRDLSETVKQLRDRDVKFISPQAIEFPNSYGYDQGCWIEDPNGHAILLVKNSYKTNS